MGKYDPILRGIFTVAVIRAMVLEIHQLLHVWKVIQTWVKIILVCCAVTEIMAYAALFII